MKRRRSLLVAGGVLLAASMAGRAPGAQAVRRIGFVSPVARGRRDEALLQGLRDLGWVEGSNLHAEMRFADGQPERLHGLVDELLRHGVEVLVVGATIGARAAKSATSKIPIVFAASSDPLAGGIVTNLARPGGNITGTSLAIGDGFAGKWLELLRETLPGVSHFAALWSSNNPAAARFVNELQTTAHKAGAMLDLHQASNADQLEQVLGAIGRSNARGLIVMPSPFAASSRERLVRFAATRGLPAIYFAEDFADAGGLVSYGPSIVDAYRRAASHVDKILKGAKPGDLPVEQPTRFEVVVNLKTARALGLAIPQSVLLRAQRVIE